MRKWFDKYLTDIAHINKMIRLIIADVGDFPLFSSNHPDKFINAGVSESNAIGLAAGLSSEGYKVYIYGVSSFFLYRSYEQLKYSVSYWKKNVTFVGVGFGWKYYNIGIGHFCPDDILLVQTLPYFEIHTPFQLSQLKNILFEESNNPRYIRLTANIVDESFYEAEMNKQKCILVSYGEMVKTSMAVIERLKTKNIDAGLIALQSLNEDYVISRVSAIKNTALIIIEDQYERGGVYPILRNYCSNVVLHIGLPLLPNKIAGSRQDLMKMYGLDIESIYKRITNIFYHNE